MPLPNLNHEGELPEGIHPATIDEVVLPSEIRATL